MIDAAFIVSTIAFFAMAVVYVAACERLGKRL